MAVKRAPDVEFTSPIGIFAFPSLDEPSYGSDDYPDPDGSYKVNLVLDRADPATQDFLDKIEPHYKEALAAADEGFKQLSVGVRKKLEKVTVNPLFTTIYDPETEKETGEIEFRVKMKASGTYKKGPKEGKKWERKPTIYDADLNRMPNVPPIWGGTKGRVRMSLSPYFIGGSGLGGLKLQLVACQIIDLVQGGERSAGSLGFEKEDGYVNEAANGFGDTPADDSSDDDDNGDF